MKKNIIQSMNNFEQEFDKFTNNPHTKFLCNISSLMLIFLALVVQMVGQYSNSSIENNKEEF